MQYNMDNHMGNRMHQNNQMGNRMHQNNQMRNEHGYNMFDRMIQQRQDNNQKEFMRHQDGRLNNFYSYERMLQRQNEARNNMNNRGRFDNNQHRMFKREAESGFEYDVTAEHDNIDRQMVSRNQQMMHVMTRP